jgi:CubicO group peptidase (beta-lactamase class C family)
MSELEVQIDPASLGFDEVRLERIKTHFNKYVTDQRLSGWLATVSRGGELVWTGSGGHRNREEGLEVTNDTIWRIYSMTKAITTVAVMMLHEEGLFDLNDPAGKWIDSLKESHVLIGGTAQDPKTEPAKSQVTIQHLLTHTSGLTYDFQEDAVSEIYRLNGSGGTGYRKDATLAELVDDWCNAPLLFHPGEKWNYSFATDVLGRLVEIWSGMTLREFFMERIFAPLGMHDSDFYCPQEKLDRLAMLYVPGKDGAVPYVDLAVKAEKLPSGFSGGGGLLSTAHDYNRFMAMLLNGGELDGVRLLSSRTVSLMTQNHLPDNTDLATLAIDSWSETAFDGIGFGLGFAVLIDRAKNKNLGSEGLYNWGGAASTAFWIDPEEDITVSFFTQLMPSSTYPIRRELQTLVYQALAD